MLRKLALILAATACIPAMGGAATYAELQAERPDLFDPVTGFRIAQERAPSPDDVPAPIEIVSATEAKELIDQGAVAIDVVGAAYARIDEDTGEWVIEKVRESLPGAVWLPETGRGNVKPEIETYLSDSLNQMTTGDLGREIVVFCKADCWHSWNAAQRIADLGYSNVFWFKNGTDGWKDIDGPVSVVTPLPLRVE
ncbi:MAG: rhodanese-like domain-containing protein [Pseudomonadota bacterium]